MQRLVLVTIDTCIYVCMYKHCCFQAKKNSSKKFDLITKC